MRFLGSQSSPCFLFLGGVNWTVPPICFPREHRSSASSSRKPSGTAVAEFPSPAALTSAPFIPQMTIHPSFLSTVLVSEFVPAESVTASLLLSTAAQLDVELWGGLAVPHVHLFVHFSRMCWSSAPGPARWGSLGCGEGQNHSSEKTLKLGRGPSAGGPAGRTGGSPAGLSPLTPGPPCPPSQLPDPHTAPA